MANRAGTAPRAASGCERPFFERQLWVDHYGGLHPARRHKWRCGRGRLSWWRWGGGGGGGRGGGGGGAGRGGGGGGGRGGPSIGVVEDATSTTSLTAANLDGNVFTLGPAGAGGAHGTLGQPAGAAGLRVEYRKL